MRVCVCVRACYGQRYLQLFPGVRELVDPVLEVSVATAPQRLGSAQQAALLALHHGQLNVAALQTQDAQASGQARHQHRRPGRRPRPLVTC